MSSITTLVFWKDTAERVLSTAAQSAIATIGVTATLGGINWEQTGSITAVASILSLLKAIVAGTATSDGTASLVKTAPALAPDLSTVPDVGDTSNTTP
jgi:predicted secreted protein